MDNAHFVGNPMTSLVEMVDSCYQEQDINWCPEGQFVDLVDAEYDVRPIAIINGPVKRIFSSQGEIHVCQHGCAGMKIDHEKKKSSRLDAFVHAQQVTHLTKESQIVCRNGGIAKFEDGVFEMLLVPRKPGKRNYPLTCETFIANSDSVYALLRGETNEPIVLIDLDTKAEVVIERDPSLQHIRYLSENTFGGIKRGRKDQFTQFSFSGEIVRCIDLPSGDSRGFLSISDHELVYANKMELYHVSLVTGDARKILETAFEMGHSMTQSVDNSTFFYVNVQGEKRYSIILELSERVTRSRLQ